MQRLARLERITPTDAATERTATANVTAGATTVVSLERCETAPDHHSSP